MNPSQIQITVDQMLAVVGKQTVEIELLRQENARLTQALAAATKPADKPADTPAK